MRAAMRFVSFILALSCVALTSSAQMKIPDVRDNLINDFGNLIPDTAEREIKQITRPLSDAKVSPIVIVTVTRLRDYRVQADQVPKFARLIFDSWGVGSAATGNKGILMLIAKEDRKIHIELGKGYDTSFHDVATRICQNVIAPEFRRNDYGKGVLDGVNAVRERIINGGEIADPSLPVEAPGKTGTDDLGPEGTPSTGDAPSESSSTPAVRTPPSESYTLGFPRPDLVPQVPFTRTGPAHSFDCGSWLCFGFGVLFVLSLLGKIFRRRPSYTYGYPPYGGGGMPPGMPMPPMGRGGPGWGGVLGGLLGGLLLGRSLNRGRDSGGMFSSMGSSGGFLGSSSSSDWGSGGGFGSDSGGSSFGGGESGGGGGSSW